MTAHLPCCIRIHLAAQFKLIQLGSVWDLNASSRLNVLQMHNVHKAAHSSSPSAHN